MIRNWLLDRKKTVEIRRKYFKSTHEFGLTRRQRILLDMHGTFAQNLHDDLLMNGKWKRTDTRTKFGPQCEYIDHLDWPWDWTSRNFRGLYNCVKMNKLESYLAKMIMMHVPFVFLEVVRNSQELSNRSKLQQTSEIHSNVVFKMLETNKLNSYREQ